jgi:hypothetical protein
MRSHRGLFLSLVVLVALVVVTGSAWGLSRPGATDDDRSGTEVSASGEPDGEYAAEEDEEGEDGGAAEEAAAGRARIVAARTAQQQAAPVQSAPATGWSGSTLFSSTGNDWEPAVASAPGSGDTYVLTTRYGGTKACKNVCPDPALILRTSTDYGKTWGTESYLCACKNVKAQNDPELVALANGVVYAAWMNDWKIVFSRSTDRGRTWSAPVGVIGNLSWSDKPIMVASPDGKDVFIAFNKSDAIVAVSHNSGATWTQVTTEANGRYHFANGGTYLSGGTIVFSEVSYAQDTTGPDTIQIHRSTDNGATWKVVNVDTVQEMPHCTSTGCGTDYYGPQAVVAADANGKVYLAYNGNSTALAPQRAYVRVSSDRGATWSARGDVTGLTGSGSGTAGAGFPAIAATGNGDVRLFFMDDRNGTSAWNTWYTRSTDAGNSWTAPVRLSDATSGPGYVTATGFTQPYGDYGQVAVRADGGTIAVWAEGVSYTGPGGTWINRTTP